MQMKEVTVRELSSFLGTLNSTVLAISRSSLGNERSLVTQKPELANSIRCLYDGFGSILPKSIDKKILVSQGEISA